MARLRLGLVFGGSSVEHEVSVVSAQHVIAAADPARFEVVPLGVTREGVWLTPQRSQAELDRPEALFKKQLAAGSSLDGAADSGLAAAMQSLQALDVVFPLIHGRHGEDGTLQGMLELAGLPYVGCGVAASAVGMDKALMKSLFRGAGIPVVDAMVVRVDLGQPELDLLREVEDRVGFPAFVKPANGGSSLGVGKAGSREELAAAITEASQHDRKLVIEPMVAGREVECGVLGNAGDAQASPVGEIRHYRDFYDFEAKYLDPRTEVLAPAELPADVAARVQAMALKAYSAIDAAGMSRIDFFLTADGRLILDEINTIPGFTPGSMFPRLWAAAGVSYGELITRLVDLALRRHKE